MNVDVDVATRHGDANLGGVAAAARRERIDLSGADCVRISRAAPESGVDERLLAHPSAPFERERAFLRGSACGRSQYDRRQRARAKQSSHGRDLQASFPRRSLVEFALRHVVAVVPVAAADAPEAMQLRDLDVGEERPAGLEVRNVGEIVVRRLHGR
jgi:hypothetical protein